eukprot:scaffold895_cov315-Pinguiococcus_pyrenoidosus.AAC.22
MPSCKNEPEALPPSSATQRDTEYLHQERKLRCGLLPCRPRRCPERCRGEQWMRAPARAPRGQARVGFYPTRRQHSILHDALKGLHVHVVRETPERKRKGGYDGQCCSPHVGPLRERRQDPWGAGSGGDYAAGTKQVD